MTDRRAGKGIPPMLADNNAQELKVVNGDVNGVMHEVGVSLKNF